LFCNPYEAMIITDYAADGRFSLRAVPGLTEILDLRFWPRPGSSAGRTQHKLVQRNLNRDMLTAI